LISTVRTIKSLASAALIIALSLASQGCQTAAKPKAREGTLQGVVFDLDKAPVSGALVEIEGPSGKASALTDSQGRFSIPDLATGDYVLGFSKSMYERRSWPIAIGDFSEVVYLQAAGYWQLLDAAMAALGRKDLGEAEDFIARAKGIQDKSSTSLFLEGVLAERRGDYAFAIGDLEAAAVLDPRSPYLWLYLADLYERSGGAAEKAADALKRYLELRDDPAAEERRKALETGVRRSPDSP
jgi:tetratricopeptide (TPR) repeat protein